MSGPEPHRNSTGDEEARQRELRRLRQEVFGDVLPDTTSDERDESARETGSNDEWLRSNVPPHHG